MTYILSFPQALSIGAARNAKNLYSWVKLQLQCFCLRKQKNNTNVLALNVSRMSMKKRKQPRFKTLFSRRAGWCDWQAPIMKGYLMKCCDCGLVHELEFKTFVETKQKRDGRFTKVELPWPIRVLFRARRARK